MLVVHILAVIVVVAARDHRLVLNYREQERATTDTVKPRNTYEREKRARAVEESLEPLWLMKSAILHLACRRSRRLQIQLTKSAVVRHAVLVSLRGAVTALGRVVHLDGVFFGVELGGDLGVGLGHGVAVDHATHVASVAWDLLAADHVRGASHPVLRPLALGAVDVLIHLGASG